MYPRDGCHANSFTFYLTRGKDEADSYLPNTFHLILLFIARRKSIMSKAAPPTPAVVTVRDATLADLQFLVDGNAAMALETENLVLDKDTLQMGCAAMLNDRNKGFYLMADCEGITAGQLMVTYEHSDWRNGKRSPPISCSR
jgi:hypothetical protein